MISRKRDPDLWAKAKRAACTNAKLCDHSGRKMQWAVRHYKANGGRYSGRKSSRNKLARWTRQDWRTDDGRPSQGRRRYLPSAAWDRLTESQKRRTNEAKRRGTAQGKQYTANPDDVRRVVADVRGSPGPAWMSYADAARWEAEAAELGVSEVARGSGGFMRMYQRHGARLRNVPVSDTLTWGRKRDNFVRRHMAQYRSHPTRRRWLALVMWAYLPPGRRP